MSKGLDVKLKGKIGHYSEIYGAGDGLEYSFLDPKTFEAYHYPTCCKDFFTDAFWSETMGKPTSIWGFVWKPGTLPANARKFEMALQFTREADFGASKSSTMELFLNSWEKQMDIPLSRVRPDITGKLAVIQFDKMWTTRPVMISLLTLLMRLAPAYNGEPMPKFIDHIAKGNPYGRYDAGELSKKGIVSLLKDIYNTGEHPSPNQTFEQYKDPHGCHHSGGLIAYTTGVATG